MKQEALAQKLRLLRAERGLTLVQASALTGVTRGTLSELEGGKRTAYMPTLAKIAEGYGVDVRELLLEEEAAPKAEAPSPGQPRSEVPESLGRPSIVDIALDAARRLDASEKGQFRRGDVFNLDQRYANEAMARLRDEYGLSADDAEELVDFMQKKHVWLQQNYERLEAENAQLREKLAEHETAQEETNAH